jgi:hypothetical protein
VIEPVIGYAPYALPLGASLTDNLAATISLTAVSGGTSLSVAIPMHIPGLMWLKQLAIYNKATANLRTAEWRIYRDEDCNNNNPNEIPYANGTFSFTPSAAGVQASTVAGSDPVAISPGIVWLVIRNTSSTYTFDIGVAGAGTMNRDANMRKNIGSLGSTLSMSGWAVYKEVFGVRLEAVVYGNGSAW